MASTEVSTVTDEAPGGVTPETVAARLYLAVGRLRRSLRRDADLPGLGHGSVSALATLVRCGPMRVGDLAARERVAPPTLSRIMAVLQDTRYVRRESDPADGRASLVAATPKGERFVVDVRSSQMQDLRRRIEHLPADRRAKLVAALEVLEQLIADEDGRSC